MVEMKGEYPEKHQGFKLNWIENEPKHKEGDSVLVLKEGVYELVKLEKLSREPMQLKWVFQGRCRSCTKPGSTINVSKYVYRWNDKTFTEGSEIDPVKELNKLTKLKDHYNDKATEYIRKASLYEQLKASINGELIIDDD